MLASYNLITGITGIALENCLSHATRSAPLVPTTTSCGNQIQTSETLPALLELIPFEPVSLQVRQRTTAVALDSSLLWVSSDKGDLFRHMALFEFQSKGDAETQVLKKASKPFYKAPSTSSVL